MRNKYGYGLVGLLVGVISYGFSFLKEYNDVKGNFLFIIFLLAFYGTVGTIIGGMLVENKTKKKKDVVGEKKIEKF